MKYCSFSWLWGVLCFLMPVPMLGAAKDIYSFAIAAHCSAGDTFRVCSPIISQLNNALPSPRLQDICGYHRTSGKRGLMLC